MIRTTKTLAALAALAAALAACATPAMDGSANAQATQAAPKADTVLATAIANPARSEANKVRDPHRNPAETLAFFGLKPGMTVIEVQPGSYYAEILAPYAKATGGKYIGTGNQIAAVADQATWGPQTYVPFNKDSGPLVPAGTADMVVTFRNFHNWYWQPGLVDKYFADFAAALKPGGRVALLTFHSGEDRRVKKAFQEGLRSGVYAGIATEVVRAGMEEQRANPRSSSAKLRWAVRATSQS